MTKTGYSRRVTRATFDPLKGKNPSLVHLDIELTERCNNRCIHCYINRPEDDHEAEAREMGTGFVLDLLKQAAELGCLTVRFTGGEPLLRPDFVEIYQAARRMGMQVILFTNARLITNEIAALFSRVPPGQPIEVSVYGMNSGSYDAVAGIHGAYDEFRRGVDLLLQCGVPFVVKSAILPQNRRDRSDFETWATGIPGMDTRPRYVVNFDLRARRDDPDKNRRISAFRLTSEQILSEISRDPGYLKERGEFCSRFMSPGSNRLFTCGAGCGVCVDSYGYAQMCLLLRHSEMVKDLRDTSLKVILTECFPRLRELRATNQEYLHRCAVCFIHGLCDQCPAKSWIEHGTLDTPVEYLCEIAHAEARYLGLVGESELAWEVEEGGYRISHLLSRTQH